MGNLLNIFSPYDKNRPLRVICCVGKRPEITVSGRQSFLSNKLMLQTQLMHSGKSEQGAIQTQLLSFPKH